MSPSLTTFLFEAANFIALAALLGWLLFEPVRKALADQQAKVKAGEDEAKEKLSEARSIRADVEQQRKTLATELEQMRVEARGIAKDEAAAIVSDARAAMERERATLRRDALNIEKAQAARIARAVAAAAHTTLTKLFAQLEGPDLEDMLLQAACRELKAFSNNSLAPVTVESAQPLEGDRKTAIETALGNAKKKAVFRVVPELTSGLRVSTSQGLIDASVTGLATYAEQSLSTEIEAVVREDASDV